MAPKEHLGRISEGYQSFGNLWKFFPKVPSVTENFPEVLRVILKEVRAFSRVLGTSSSLLDSTLLGLTLWLCRSFSNLRKLFPKVPSGTGNFLKASESSSRQSEPSLSFLCDSRIVIAVLYKYEASPLQNIITFTSLNSLNPRSDLRLSA